MVSVLLHHLSHWSSSDCVWRTGPGPRPRQVISTNSSHVPTPSGDPTPGHVRPSAARSASNAPGLEGCRNVYLTARGVNTSVTQRNQGLVVSVPDPVLTVGFYLPGSWRRPRVVASPCQRSCLNLRSFSVTLQSCCLHSFHLALSVKRKRVRFA